MDVTFKLNGTDCSALLSTYNVIHEISYGEIITTMDNTEHFGRQHSRAIVVFSLLPLTDQQSANLYSLLTGMVDVIYTDPDRNSDITATMRLDGNISKIFGIRSINGNRYYKGEAITLRALR